MRSLQKYGLGSEFLDNQLHDIRYMLSAFRYIDGRQFVRDTIGMAPQHELQAMEIVFADDAVPYR